MSVHLWICGKPMQYAIIVNGVDRNYPKEIFMDKYECTACGYIYDPAEGDPEHGIPKGTPFEKLPEDWICPWCSVGKEHFEKTA
jgi:rubredoxin